jgi:hypothetical protein
MIWFQFWDMSSGGTQKTPWKHVFVEAKDVFAAEEIFERKTGRNPHHETCSCCGEDFAIHHDSSLEQVTAYQRGCDYDEAKKEYVDSPRRGRQARVTLEEFIARPEILVIRADTP